MSHVKHNANNPTTRIYVACLAAYNTGNLHGHWIDAVQDGADIETAIQEVLAKSPEANAEEWAIHDYEGFAGISLNEHESLETVAALAASIAQHGQLFAEVYAHTGDIDSATSNRRG